VFVVLWSSGFAFAALGLPHTQPITFLVLRYLIVVTVLAIAIAGVRPPLPRGRVWLHLIVVGLLLQAAFFGLLNLAIDRIPPSTAALIVCLQPVLVALLAPGLVGEHVPAARWAGLVLGLAGAVLVIVVRSDRSGADAGGIALACGALLAITLATLYENRFGTELHPVSSNLVRFGVALVATAIPAILFESLHVEWTGEFVVALLYLAFANSLLAITLLLAMLRRGTASQVSALFFLVPPLAALIAWAILGEALPAPAWLGMALAAVGVAVATRR
jgi:drug/metabolite transporter (DMT)-like permease